MPHADGSRRYTLQRLFSTFPGGWPGFGLLLLRAAAGVTAGMQGIACLGAGAGASPSLTAVGIASLLVGVALGIGAMTPLCGSLMAAEVLAVSFSWLPAPQNNPFSTPLSAVLVFVVALAVVFLGPGAFSLDARLFGRREIIIPRNPNKM